MDKDIKSPAIFEDRSQDVMAQNDAASVARSIQEIQAALVIAQRFPRDEVRAEARIMEACKRKSLAEVAEYEYSRGGSRITGPTIDLLRAIANRWQNLLWGWAEVERRNGQSMVRCWAWDTQNNSRSERTFVVRHWRDTQAGGYQLDDERDIYELCANMAARRVRACMEEVIDADIVDKAIDQCRKTLKEGEKLPIKDRAASVVIAFAEHGVTQEMIEARLGNKMTAVSENQLASLRRIYKSLKDGVGKREDYFKGTPVEPNFGSQKPPEAPAPSQGATQAEKFSPGASAEQDDPFPSPEPSKPEAPESPPLSKKETPASVPAAQETSAGTPPLFNPLKALRELAKISKIKEGMLLQWAAETGRTDGSVGSLEEMQLQFPSVVQLLVDNWSDVAGRIHKVTKEAK